MKESGMSTRQLVESMIIFYDPEAASGLSGTIQFKVTGPEPGEYYIEFGGDDAVFRLGVAANADLTINTPSDIWMQICEGETDGAEALGKGLYSAEGNLDFLIRYDSIFNAENEEEKIVAPPDQKPDGPLSIPGNLWMTVALAPWMVFWFTFDVELSKWISVAVPLALSLFILIYRSVFGKPEWLEIWTAIFFILFAVFHRIEFFDIWGTVISQAVMSIIWLTTLFRLSPLTSDYIKWGYIKRMWNHSIFIHPNAVLTAMWGYQFIAASLLGIAAKEIEDYSTIFTILRYGLLVPAFMITNYYPQKAGERRYVWEKSVVKLRVCAAIGLIAAVAIIVSLIIWAPSRSALPL